MGDSVAGSLRVLGSNFKSHRYFKVVSACISPHYLWRWLGPLGIEMGTRQQHLAFYCRQQEVDMTQYFSIKMTSQNLTIYFYQYTCICISVQLINVCSPTTLYTNGILDFNHKPVYLKCLFLLCPLHEGNREPNVAKYLQKQSF